ncbi:hypothetical protein [Intestinibacter bartlettii]|uniref:hypothetical protein n=1 Tax=Intestinibacter bartlettii TaxID=261299 RepID=UPI000821FD5E|nr:hypothetical protein [Intestinibacter bartlettii]SCI52366.1 Uncharacterised protein [uncultured Clostridium sp.]
MKLKLQSEGVKQSDIKTLEQRLFLVRLYRNTSDPEGRLGSIEGAEFTLNNRKEMTIEDFKRHYIKTYQKIGQVNHDSYESSLLYALRLNIEELEREKEGE